MIKNEDIVELELECSTLCNARCPLCYRNYNSFVNSPYNKSIVRPISDTIQQLDQFKNLKFVMLVGSMSEPTILKDDFLRLVEYLKNRHIITEICTNGDTNDRYFWETLGGLLDKTDMVFFTICGATQEIHERYRVGTNLGNIVRNAGFLRSVNPVDYAQCIRFNYNSEHFDSLEFKQFVRQFSHVYMTETFFPKNIDNYRVKFDINDFLPCREKISSYRKLKNFAEKRFDLTKDNVSDCMCRRTNRYQMDVFGNIYPCYLFLEASNGNKWSEDETDITYVKHDCCKFCDLMVQKYAKRYNLEYII